MSCRVLFTRSHNITYGSRQEAFCPNCAQFEALSALSEEIICSIKYSEALAASEQCIGTAGMTLDLQESCDRATKYWVRVEFCMRATRISASTNVVPVYASRAPAQIYTWLTWRVLTNAFIHKTRANSGGRRPISGLDTTLRIVNHQSAPVFSEHVFSLPRALVREGCDETQRTPEDALEGIWALHDGHLASCSFHQTPGAEERALASSDYDRDFRGGIH